jgi:hypothetical protein
MKEIFLTSFVFISLIVSSQEPNEKENIFIGTRFVNSHSTNLAQKGKLNLLIQHRFGEISGGFYELFGLDQATMRLGFEYGFTDNFMLGVGRSSFLKTYDVYAKYSFINQNDNFPFTAVLAIEGGLPLIRNYYPASKDNFNNKFSGSSFLLLSKTIGNFGLQVSPGFLNTGYLLSESKDFFLFVFGIGGSVKLSKKVSANLEYLYQFNSKFSTKKPLSVGIDIDTGGHLFQLILSNSQQFTGPSLYTYTYGDWAKGKLFFGFNLIREFRLKNYY